MTSIKLGSILKQRREKYDGIDDLPISGVSKNGLISPKQDDADTSIYNVFYKNDFVFNPARMELNSIEINLDFEKAICSSLYEVFYIKDTSKILPLYLYLFLKRNEFARKCWFKALGSARDYFRFKNLCDLEIEIPPIEIQRKYVSIYEGLLANLRSYESKLEDLKLVCDGYIEDLRKKYSLEKLGKYISENKLKNINKAATIFGISNEGFIKPKQNLGDESNYILFSFNDFVYSPPRINVGSIDLYKDKQICACSPIYVVFHVEDTTKLNPNYLLMRFKRKEFLRFTDFSSISTVRNNFNFELMKEYEIPIPPIEIQNNIVAIFAAYTKRKEFICKLKDIIKDICPILVKGALREARGEGHG